MSSKARQTSRSGSRKPRAATPSKEGQPQRKKGDGQRVSYLWWSNSNYSTSMLSLTRLHSHHLIPNTSTQLSSMPPSHTRPTKRDTSAHSRLLTPAYISRVRKEVEIPQTTQPSFCMPRDSKIFQSSKDSEISSEFTEQPSDSTTTRDNLTPTSSTTHLGLFSQLTEDQLSRKSRTRTRSMI